MHDLSDTNANSTMDSNATIKKLMDVFYKCDNIKWSTL